MKQKSKVQACTKVLQQNILQSTVITIKNDLLKTAEISSLVWNAVVQNTRRKANSIPKDRGSTIILKGISKER